MSTRTRSNRKFFAGFLLVALLIAGLGSYYASSHPDGLEFVAGKTRYLEQGKDSPTADGPFADYSTKGVDDSRISGGVPASPGCLARPRLSGGGLFWVLRRRDPAPSRDTA